MKTRSSSAETAKQATTPNGGKRKYAAPAVDTMLDIVEFLSEHQRPYGVSELSRTLGISTNLAFRVLKRMVDRGYAEVDPESGGHQLSARFFTLGMKLYWRFDLRNRARRHLELLCGETGETCQLQVPDGDRMLVAESVSPPSDFFLSVVPGSRVFYHANAFGKVVLAFSDTEFVNSALSERPALTDKTQTDPRLIREELAIVRREGLGYDREEYAVGVYCVGAPVFDVRGIPRGGIGLTGLSGRYDPNQEKRLNSLVLKCAADIAADIGYDGDFYAKRMKKEN